MIHGFGAAIDWWDEIAPALATDHRVIRVDLIGHGGTAAPAAGYTIPRQAELVAAVLDRLGIDRVIVIGHSMGGEVATALTERDPARIAAMILIDSPPTPGASFTILTETAMTPVLGELLSHFETDKTVRRGLAQGFAPGFPVPEKFVADLKQLTYTAFRSAHDDSIAYRTAKPTNERLAALMPVPPCSRSPAPRTRSCRRTREIFRAGARRQDRDDRGGGPLSDGREAARDAATDPRLPSANSLTGVATDTDCVGAKRDRGYDGGAQQLLTSWQRANTTSRHVAPAEWNHPCQRRPLPPGCGIRASSIRRTGTPHRTGCSATSVFELALASRSRSTVSIRPTTRSTRLPNFAARRRRSGSRLPRSPRIRRLRDRPLSRSPGFSKFAARSISPSSVSARRRCSPR